MTIFNDHSFGTEFQGCGTILTKDVFQKALGTSSIVLFRDFAQMTKDKLLTFFEGTELNTQRKIKPFFVSRNRWIRNLTLLV